MALRTFGVLVVALVGCGPTTFVCEDRVQCVRDQMQGRCEPTGRCSYRDDTCPSGWRYGANAGDDFANLCVEPLPEASTGDVPTTTSETTTSETTTSETTTGATATSETTTGGATTGTSSGSSSGTTGDGPASTETSST